MSGAADPTSPDARRRVGRSAAAAVPGICPGLGTDSSYTNWECATFKVTPSHVRSKAYCCYFHGDSALLRYQIGTVWIPEILTHDHLPQESLIPRGCRGCDACLGVATFNMAALNANAKYIAEKLSESVGVDLHVAEVAINENLTTINAFMAVDGPLKLIFFYQIPEISTDQGDFLQNGSKPKLFLTTGERERCRGKAYYFIRLGNSSKPLEQKNLEQDISYGEITPQILDSFYGILKSIFIPSITSQDWGKANVSNACCDYSAHRLDCLPSF